MCAWNLTSKPAAYSSNWRVSCWLTRQFDIWSKLDHMHHCIWSSLPSMPSLLRSIPHVTLPASTPLSPSPRPPSFPSTGLHNAAQNCSNSLPSHLPDNHYSSDLSTGGEGEWQLNIAHSQKYHWEWWGNSLVICRVGSKVQMICIWSSWCHCHPIISCSSKIQNVLPLPAYPGCLGKKVVKWV